MGFVAAIDHAWAANAINAFAASRPDVEVVVHFGDLLDPTGGLRDGRADVAFTYGPFDTTGLELHPIHSEPIGVSLAADHPLATKSELTIADIVAELTFDFPTPDSAWRAFWSAESFRQGKPARYVAQYRNLEGLVSALRAGLGVHLATQPLRETLATDIVWRPVPDYPPLQYFVAQEQAINERPSPTSSRPPQLHSNRRPQRAPFIWIPNDCSNDMRVLDNVGVISRKADVLRGRLSPRFHHHAVRHRVRRPGVRGCCVARGFTSSVTLEPAVGRGPGSSG